MSTLLEPMSRFRSSEYQSVASLTRVLCREVDKAKLKVFSGEATDSKTTALAEIPDTAILDATESTPLLKSNAVPSNSTKHHTWKTIVLALLGALEVLGRASVLIFVAVQVIRRKDGPKSLASPIIFLVGWIYATLKPIIAPRLTVPYGILAVHGFSCLSGLGFLYAVGLEPANDNSQTPGSLALQIINIFITLLGICIISSMPIHLNGEPTIDEAGLLPAMDDFVTLYQWLSFSWMTDFVSIGAVRSVEESDLWQLSHLLRSRVIMAKFRHWRGKTLLRRLLSANALDLGVNFVLSVCSFLFLYLDLFTFVF